MHLRGVAELDNEGDERAGLRHLLIVADFAGAAHE